MNKIAGKTGRFHEKGDLFIVSAPSGTGKTTLCKRVCAAIPGLKLSVSYTTRSRRKGEKSNVHYTFVNETDFKSMIYKGEFAEWAFVHGNLYGTSFNRLKELAKKGYDIILDIDVQGAQQIKRSIKNAVFIFILPPSLKVLEHRLRTRKSDSSEVIKKRLQKAHEEIMHYSSYDYVIINDSLERAVRELESIIFAKRLQVDRIDKKWLKKLRIS